MSKNIELDELTKKYNDLSDSYNRLCKDYNKRLDVMSVLKNFSIELNKQLIESFVNQEMYEKAEICKRNIEEIEKL